MIYYLARGAHLYTIRSFLESWGRHLQPFVRPLAYEALPQLPRLPLGSYVFSDLERLAPEELETAAQVHTALAEAGGADVALLNHPTASLRRYELLRALHRAGINDFNVYRATEHRRPQAWPVFLRREDDHVGPWGEPVSDAAVLEARLSQLRRAGHSLDPVLITELLDTADAHGIYRKYSAFVVGDRIVPRHLFFAREWMVKYPAAVNARQVQEEMDYLLGNPHESALREVFRIAGIRYGRIDYAVHRGRLQVWEINTNPWVMSFDDGGGTERRSAHRAFWQAITAALEAQRPALRGTRTLPNPLWHTPAPRAHRALRGAMQAIGLGAQYRPLVERVRGLRRRPAPAPRAVEN